MPGNIELEELDYTEWNRRVRGFMKIWDIAEVLGITACLESHLEELPHSDIAACLAEKGNCRDTYLRLFLLSLRALLAEEPQAVRSFPDAMWEEQLLSILDVAVVRDPTPFLRLTPECEGSEARILASLIHGGRS